MCTDNQFKLEGNRSFRADKNPLVLNPYPKSKWAKAYESWMAGWNEAAFEYKRDSSFQMGTEIYSRNNHNV